MDKEKATSETAHKEAEGLSEGLDCPACGEGKLEECRRKDIEFYGEDDDMTITVNAVICFKCRYVESIW